MKLQREIRKVYRRLFLKPIPVFVMHQVGESMNPMVDRESDWSSFDLFKKNVDFLNENYHIVSLPQVHEMLKRQRSRFKKYAVITFDDAYKSILPALQYLKGKHIPVTVFVNSAYLNGDSYSCVNVKTYLRYQNSQEPSAEIDGLINDIDSLWDVSGEDYRIKMEKCLGCIDMSPLLDDLYIDKPTLFSLDYESITIGMHGHEHFHSSNLLEADFRANVENNVNALKSHKRYIPYFAYPWGMHNAFTDRFLKSSGLVPVLCDGACNYRFRETISRMPVDGMTLEKDN